MLSKVEYWKKWDFFDLLEDLHKAEKMLLNYNGGFSDKFNSTQDFHNALIDEIDNIEFGNSTDLSKLYEWFAPTSVWDDFLGKSGNDLGNRIFERVNKWKKGNS